MKPTPTHVAVVLVTIGLSFFGGMKFGESKAASADMRGVNGGGQRTFRTGGNAAVGGRDECGAVRFRAEFRGCSGDRGTARPSRPEY